MSGAYSSLINNAAATYGVPSPLLAAQIGAESSFNPSAINPISGASGIAQFMPATAGQFGINPFDPAQSINAAALYDSQLYGQTGSWTNAMQSYGTLPGNLNNLTNGQQNVLAQAQAADQANTPWFGQSITDPNANAAMGANALGAGITGSIGSALGSTMGSVSSYFNDTLGVVGTYLERGLVILLAIAFVLGGILMLRGGYSTPKIQAVSDLKRAIT